ncbi:hypothetical protein [Bacillus ndiopicus]|uniref:hypothetical protein n=1 Tax=Bacillus ndiopicus TaxID=1347368 RepID=UPI0005A8582A|nr:hypothetical protein [Bacillus ndiopicus]
MMILSKLKPLAYITEWILFFYLAIAMAIFNLIYFLNIITVDMPWEKPISLGDSFLTLLMSILGVGLICFFYLNHLIGNHTYKRFKEMMWGALFAFNALGCLICWGITYKFSVLIVDGVLLLVTTLVSMLLVMQIFRRQYY